MRRTPSRLQSFPSVALGRAQAGSELAGPILRALAAGLTFAAWVLLSSPGVRSAPVLDEFKVKREAVFEFARKPVVTRQGDQVTVAFETKGLCDVTVAVEEAGTGAGPARIVRHLASGVLGPNAPKPFQKNSRAQVIVWDGKNDKGEYIDDKENVVVRVSLGLKPRFERTLYWSPTKRAAVHHEGVAIQARPEGVYVYDGGQAADHLRLFSHAGEYLRTVYPFPAGRMKDVQGLLWHAFPQDGQRLPIKPTYQMCTFLTSGENAKHIVFKDGRYAPGPPDPAHKGEYGSATTDISVAGSRIALGAFRLSRLATDGTSGGLPLYGPNIDLRNESGKPFYKATASYLAMTLGGYAPLTNLRPHRFALSPDGRTLYLTRYIENYALDSHTHNYWHQGVFRMDFKGTAEPTLFLGADKKGSDAKHFFMPADVAVDARGRVYVADLGNHRVQVFQADGTFVKSIPVEAPAQLAVSPMTGELYVFSWELLPHLREERLKLKVPYVLRRFRSADDPRLLATYELPIGWTAGRFEQCAEVDFWSDPVTIWVYPGVRQVTPRRRQRTGILVLAERDGALKVVRDFEREARRMVGQTRAPGNNRQRLYWDPRRERLYIGEGGFHFQNAVVIDPATGKTEVVHLPFDAEDMCFDADGLACLRTPELVARYDPDTWREVPWDYGVEREKVTYNSHSGRREAHVISGLPLPVNSGWHHGGIHVSPKGSIVVGCLYLYGPPQRGPANRTPVTPARPYAPQLYPGRVTNAVYGAEYVHVWDNRGRTMYQDAIPGLGTLNGVAIDNHDDLYVLSAAPRVYPDGTRHFNYLAGTLMKFKPGRGKIISDSDRVPIPLPEHETPKRAPDVSIMPGNAWVTGAEWFYGGVGWHGKNYGLGCGCRNTRFALDYFGRSFAPEIDRYSVAVLDTNGNVILRIGRYGNVDDGVPLVADGGPPAPRSIGGDEVALMHGAYVAAQTDRRLFIADIGNYRILSVRLDYHATERVRLMDTPSGE